jgi:hypothetical protein
MFTRVPNAVLSLQPTFTRRTSGHCLGAYIAENFCSLSVKCSVSLLSHSLIRASDDFNDVMIRLGTHEVIRQSRSDILGSHGSEYEDDSL